MRLILFGPPGAGKGTQATAISDMFSLVHIATGDIFRENVRNKTELGQRAQQFMDRGELVPDEVVIAMIEDRITQDDTAGGFLLDGFPRTVPQAKALDDISAVGGHAIDGVIRLLVSDEELLSRLLGRAADQGRSDDTQEVIENRLAVYRDETEPLIAFYRERDLLHEVDGEGDISEVRERVLDAVREVERTP
jgi:adenylate kinase